MKELLVNNEMKFILKVTMAQLTFYLIVGAPENLSQDNQSMGRVSTWNPLKMKLYC
jgi:hypothetical protein